MICFVFALLLLGVHSLLRSAALVLFFFPQKFVVANIVVAKED
jgi:hypothetical protein